MTNRRDLLKGIGGGLAVVTLGGAGVAVADDDTDDQGDGTTAEVRIGHLSPDTPAVDVYVGGSDLDPTASDTSPAVGDLHYPTFAPDSDGGYISLEAGTYDVAVTSAGVPSVEAIRVSDFELEANRDYTVLAVGELAPEEATFGDGDEPGIQALPLVDNGDDDTVLPPADATLVRAVHASPDAGAVDVVVSVGGSDVARLENVTFGTASSYLELPADAEISIEKDRDGDGTKETLLDPIANPLDDGQKGSAYVIDNVSPEEGGDDPLETGVDDAELGAVTTLDATNPSLNRGRGRDRGRGRGRGD
jgi:hypothetical protein